MSKGITIDQKLEVLRLALIKGEESGYVENFDPVEFKAKLREEHMAAKRHQLLRTSQ